MKHLLLTLPLLAACACPPEYRTCGPELERCICTGPTGSITATARDHDRAPRVAPEPDPEPEPETEPEPDDEEPDSETDPEGYERWKEKQEAGL